ncbi:rRNA biogenesis protein rrp36 [Linnemannia exigua]|uniref:rRNA biogenesis protein RRP36 n=1 Tax=Linnemannia exigua TaxID=604196 RepID=A0AAD4D0X8_9FUNG|nr:rRNA biogenesis protein rrp36 [Linnemannia exigua]
MALKGKKQEQEDAAARAMRRMQTYDESDSDLDQNNSDGGSDQELSGDDEEDSEQDSEEEDSDDLKMHSEVDEDSEDEEDEEDEEEDDEEDDSDDSDDSDEDTDDSDDSDDSGDDDDDKKLKELQKNLAQIPFDKLAEIQQKVGMKVFHQTLRGAEKKSVATKGLQRKSQDRYDDDDSEEDSEEDEEDSEEEERRPKNKMDKLRNAMNKDKKERKIIEKRADKNRPMEIGSKKPVGRFRQVVEVASAKRRDPRFDSLSGKLDNDLFEKSYSFLKDYQADEMKKLKELIKKERDADMKDKLQNQLSRMVDRQATEAAQKRRQEIKRDHKRKEKELVMKGKNPFFLKKSDQKKLELIDKFKHLSESPKALARAMEKRRKRNSAKEKTKILGGNKRRRVD